MEFSQFSLDGTKKLQVYQIGGGGLGGVGEEAFFLCFVKIVLDG